MSNPATILIVDDDLCFAESNKDLLEAQGYRVVMAHDGASGLEVARKERPDLMILDVMMATEIEGLEISRKIRESPELQHMRVLLVTGVTKAMHLPYRLEPDTAWLPVDHVLEKPIEPTRLIAEIEKTLSAGAK